MVEFEIFAPGTDTDINAAYFAYIRRDSDGAYWDRDDSTFKTYTALVDGRVDFVEDVDQLGVWNLQESLGITTGTLTMLPRDAQTSFLLPESVEQVYVWEGARLAPLRDHYAAIYEHYSGFNALQLLGDIGEPVEGAKISVYTKADYDQDKFERIIGESCTNLHGYWVHPVFVAVGATYTIVYSKAYEVDTTVHEIVVP